MPSLKSTAQMNVPVARNADAVSEVSTVDTVETGLGAGANEGPDQGHEFIYANSPQSLFVRKGDLSHYVQGVKGDRERMKAEFEVFYRL